MKIANLYPFASAAIVLLMASGAMAAGDVAKGKSLTKKKCAACHTMDKGGKTRLGPNLFDVLGRKAGSVSGYKYSKAMASSGIVWDEIAFSEFLVKPRKIVKGTKMSFVGLKKAGERADILAYFRTLTDGAQSQAASGNPADGRIAAIAHCQACHSFEKGGKMVFGPNLFDIYGKPAGAIKGYNYSEALAASGITWTDKNLLGFLADPEGFLEGNKANFPGVKSARKRADIIAYIKTLK